MYIKIRRYKRIESLIQNHMRHERSECAHEERVALYKRYEYQHAGPNTQGEQTEEKEETAGETET